MIGPLLKSVEEISEQIGEYDKQIEEIAKRYPESEAAEAGVRSGAR